MNPYLDLMCRILQIGARKSDRRGTGTVSLFGEQICRIQPLTGQNAGQVELEPERPPVCTRHCFRKIRIEAEHPAGQLWQRLGRGCGRLAKIHCGGC